MKISSYDVMPINDADKFEDFCCDLWKAAWRSHTAQKHGRKGQSQQGVDVYGMPSGEMRYHGVQCKRRSNALGSKLTEKEVLEEVEEAKKFQPALQHLIIATTSPSDTTLQALARTITLENAANNLFSVTILGWNEILLMLDEHEAVARKYYPNMFSTDTLAKKQEALLVEENPTILIVQDLRFESFLGDDEQFLTLEVENISKLTAQNVKLDIHLPVVDGQAVIVDFTPSQCININAIPNYSISAGKSQLIPFASVSEAHQKLSRDLNPWRLVGVGLHPNIPDDLTQRIRQRDPSIFLPCLSVNSIGFAITLAWSTIFGQEKKVTLGGYLYLWDEAGDMCFAEKAIF